MGQDEDARHGFTALTASGSIPPTPSAETKYPQVTVRLTGTNGNTMAVISSVRRALAAAERDNEIERGAAEKWIATAWGCRSYDALLLLAMKWVKVE